MKFVFVSVSLFLSAFAAQAMPNVGDSAFYEGTFDGQYAQERMTLMEYNVQTNQYRKESIVAVGNNSPQTSEEWVNASDLPTDAAMQNLLANCAQNSGVAETVSVPAGVMATCRIPLQRGGTANLAPVPFGIVKMDTVTEEGKSLSVYLSSFSRGNQ